jgi:Ca-activated chloride channel family protein
MELLADKGNGNYANIDSLAEGTEGAGRADGGDAVHHREGREDPSEFNPARVAGYRLIGYENRLLAKEDFNDDAKTRARSGPGHTVTALYEIIPCRPAGSGSPSVDPLKYQHPTPLPRRKERQLGRDSHGQIALQSARWREERVDRDSAGAATGPAVREASTEFRFASAVAAFGMKLRNSPQRGEISWDGIQQIARGALGADVGQFTSAEFIISWSRRPNACPAENRQRTERVPDQARGSVQSTPGNRAKS